MTSSQPRSIAYMEAIKSIITEISHVHALQPMLDLVVAAIQEQLDFYIASIFWYDEAAQEAMLMAQAGKATNEQPLGYRQPVAQGVLGRTLRERRALLINDVRREASYISPQGYDAGGAELCVPIWCDDRLWGAFNVESQVAGVFTEPDVLALELVSAQLGVAIANLELRTNERAMLASLQAQHDQLHELYSLVLQLSTPVIPLFPGILAMPLIGTLDEERAQHMAQELLEAIQRTRCRTVVLDVTGLAAIDAAVARAIVTLAQSCRLLGAAVVISGVRPEVAQTLVALDLSAMSAVVMRRDFADGVGCALRMQGLEIRRI
ncbi:GAF domain-containing protein [Chloroflexia bacterium SDU3-3]|nr:GAF domain-containing protein [Chloroflexia bacterium SDU3-3]